MSQQHSRSFHAKASVSLRPTTAFKTKAKHFGIVRARACACARACPRNWKTLQLLWCRGMSQSMVKRQRRSKDRDDDPSNTPATTHIHYIHTARGTRLPTCPTPHMTHPTPHPAPHHSPSNELDGPHPSKALTKPIGLASRTVPRATQRSKSEREGPDRSPQTLNP